jgi:hypothetical protein
MLTICFPFLFSSQLLVPFVLPNDCNVDGLAMADTNVVACKGTGLGLVYLWDLAATVENVPQPINGLKVNLLSPTTCSKNQNIEGQY